ncbi:ABC transporter ATP-binding protein [Aquabacterium sp.]|uniref:ABC transporter ATP-binding protein n=1 Tax=Aquabacterium sp. TaxID=1872578 RepID=UPI002C243D05|nr:ATP-binding cassette domain-containing protein [Aquabacterium sp.]HSW04602.1 ATP-binding cassette domain-containing protein [Aquabacterium sp.]
MNADPAPADGLVQVERLTLAFGPKVVQHDLDFTVRRGEVFVIMGGSGCGKSTLLRHMIGLQRPAAGFVRYGEQDLNACSDEALAAIRRSFGVAFQAGALWSSMTVGDNVMLPLRLFTDKSAAAQEQVARAKLAQVGLEASFDTLPADLSGGMRKRAAIARAMALDPPLLYLDEPSAGLDPLSSAQLDELILGLCRQHGSTVVMVTHELESIFAVADRALFLDAGQKTMTALDTPAALLDHGPEPVRAFLRRTPRPGEHA